MLYSERVKVAYPTHAKKLMRLVYFDESGSSPDEQQEPIIVVAAIIVHGDLQSGPMERDVEDLVSRLIPEHLRTGFEFHAKEMFSGSEKLRGWRKEERHNALREFIKIIPKYNIPILCGALEKAQFRKTFEKIPGLDFSQFPYLAHQTAFLTCAVEVQNWFVKYANAERRQCIADDTKQRKLLKTHFRDYRKNPEIPAVQRFDHLIDTIYFGDSDESAFLQLVDSCAFVIRRSLMGRNDVVQFYEIIEPQIQRLLDRFTFSTGRF